MLLTTFQNILIILLLSLNPPIYLVHRFHSSTSIEEVVPDISFWISSSVNNFNHLTGIIEWKPLVNHFSFSVILRLSLKSTIMYTYLNLFSRVTDIFCPCGTKSYNLTSPVISSFSGHENVRHKSSKSPSYVFKKLR